MAVFEDITPEAWADSIIYAWREMGLALVAGCTDQQIRLAEERLHFEFEASFKSLYKQTNGFHDNDWIGYLITMWSLEKIVAEAAHFKEFSLIAFGDFMINSASYGFLRGHSGVFKLYSGNDIKPEKISESFMDFITLINREDVLVY